MEQSLYPNFYYETWPRIPQYLAGVLLGWFIYNRNKMNETKRPVPVSLHWVQMNLLSVLDCNIKRKVIGYKLCVKDCSILWLDFIHGRISGHYLWDDSLFKPEIGTRNRLISPHYIRNIEPNRMGCCCLLDHLCLFLWIWRHTFLHIIYLFRMISLYH